MCQLLFTVPEDVAIREARFLIDELIEADDEAVAEPVRASSFFASMRPDEDAMY